LRRIVAWLGILGIAFAQFVATAHACALGASTGPERPRVAIAAGAAVAASHCGGHATGAFTPAPNLCEVHCTDGATPTTALDLPQVLLAPLPVSAITLAALAAAAAPEPLHAVALGRAPPLILQFGRLLI